MAVRPILENVDERITLHDELQNKIKKSFPQSSTIENKYFETKSKNLVNIVKTFEEIKLYRETIKSPPNWLNRNICEVVDTWMLFYRKYEVMRRYKINVVEDKHEEIEKLKVISCLIFIGPARPSLFLAKIRCPTRSFGPGEPATVLPNSQ